MTNRAFRSMLTAVLTVLTVTMLLVMTVLYNYFSSVQQTQLRTEAYLTAQGAEKLGISFFDRLNAGENRITWILPQSDFRTDLCCGFLLRRIQSCHCLGACCRRSA